MPIVVKEYIFTETLDTLTITVDLQGVQLASKVDVFCTDLYVKLNFNPFFFEIDLLHTVDYEQSQCLIQNGTAVLQLVKTGDFSNQLWGSAGLDVTSISNEELRVRRQESIKRMHEREEQKRAKRREEKHEKDRYLVQQQIEAERKARLEHEQLREKEKESALSEVRNWIAKNDNPIDQNVDNDGLVNKDVAGMDEQEQEPENTTIFNSDDIVQEETNADAYEEPTYSSEEETDPELIALEAKVRESLFNPKPTPPKPEKPQAPIRDTREITVSFTKRKLPMAARESKDAEYESYLERKRAEKEANAIAQSSNVSNDNVEKPSESELPSLKERAANAFKSGDYETAVIAWTEALKLVPADTGILSNLSAAHLAIARKDPTKSHYYASSISYATDALTHIETIITKFTDKCIPIDKSLYKSKATILLRRAAGYAALGKIQDAKSDLKSMQKVGEVMNCEIGRRFVGEATREYEKLSCAA